MKKSSQKCPAFTVRPARRNDMNDVSDMIQVCFLNEMVNLNNNKISFRKLRRIRIITNHGKPIS